jgi:DNA polymerase-1
MAWRSLALRHIERQGLSYEDVCGKGGTKYRFLKWKLSVPVNMLARTLTMTMICALALWPHLQADKKLAFLYDLEIKSSEALFRVERNLAF